MRSCWAAPLGGCSGVISGEHTVSECIFDTPIVRVEGFAWCKGVPKELPIRTVTRNILCTKHNQALSPVDAAAGKAFKALRDASKLFRARMNTKPGRWINKPTFKVDGVKLERWAIKTLINASVEGGRYIGHAADAPGRCPERYVEMAYGVRPTEGHAGLYAASRDGLTLDPPPGAFVSVCSLLVGLDRIVAGLFSLNGFLFCLWLDSEVEPGNLAKIQEFGEDWGKMQMTRHLARLDFNSSWGRNAADRRHFSHRVEFDWCHQPSKKY